MTESFDEHALLLRARRYEDEALGMIYDRYSPMLYRYAYRLLGQAALAEECVADTFARLLHALHEGGGPRNHLKAYLYRVAHNWIIDHRRRPVLDTVELDPETVAQPGDPPAEQMQRIDVRQSLREALFELTADQRQVLVLRYLEGLSNREIARVVNKSVGAVKGLQHRGLLKLRRHLGEQE